MSDNGTQSGGALGPEGNSAQAGGVAQDNQRINDLMSKWQSEQAKATRLEGEITRLQGLLATAVATEADLRVQLTTAQTGQQQSVTDAEGRAAAAESKVAELAADNAKLKAENGKLKFLTDNQDLAPYAAILPETADAAVLESTAKTLRDAAQKRDEAQRTQLTGLTRAGGQVGRVTPGTLSPADIETFLKTATPQEFEARLAQVKQQMGRK